jgi:hypothetical protein
MLAYNSQPVFNNSYFMETILSFLFWAIAIIVGGLVLLAVLGLLAHFLDFLSKKIGFKWED